MKPHTINPNLVASILKCRGPLNALINFVVTFFLGSISAGGARADSPNSGW